MQPDFLRAIRKRHLEAGWTIFVMGGWPRRYRQEGLEGTPSVAFAGANATDEAFNFV